MSNPLATVYAIRHIPTGNFLPSGRGRGFTHDEPLPATSKPPRLFLSRRGAHLALKAWLEGEAKEIYSYDADFGNRETIGVIYEPRPDRIPSEMEIVEVNLSIVPPEARYWGQDMLGDDTSLEELHREWNIAVLDSTDLRTIKTASIAPSAEVENLLDIINRLAGRQLTDEDYSDAKEGTL